MTAVDTTVPSQRESLSFEIDLRHPPEKVWRALTDPDLLAEFGGARYAWKMMGGKLVDLLTRIA